MVDVEVAHDPAIIDSISEYLASQHITLFGQFFNVTDPVQRRQAAEWLSGQMQSWLRYRAGQEQST